MVVERYKQGCHDQIYNRFNSKDRMLPEGLFYLHSWVNRDKDICFQLMETNNDKLIRSWTENWTDLVDFEVYPID